MYHLNPWWNYDWKSCKLYVRPSKNINESSVTLQQVAKSLNGIDSERISIVPSCMIIVCAGVLILHKRYIQKYLWVVYYHYLRYSFILQIVILQVSGVASVLLHVVTVHTAFH